MSNTFKRPMFRKGGDVGGGIMNNIVERGQYANSNAEDLNLKDSTGLKIKDQMDVIEQLSGGDNRLGDPLTQFLLQLGPSIAGQTGGGGTIGNLLLASKEPTKDLFKTLSDQKKTKQAIALDLYKDLSDSDKIALQEKVEYLMKEFDISKEEALARALPEYRKKRDPEEDANLKYENTVESIINTTKNRFGVSQIDNRQAELILADLDKLEKTNPEAHKQFIRTKSKNKYIFGTGEYNADTGEILGKNSLFNSLPENVYVYDIERGKFVYRQGNKVFTLEETITEE